MRERERGRIALAAEGVVEMVWREKGEERGKRREESYGRERGERKKKREEKRREEKRRKKKEKRREKRRGERGMGHLHVLTALHNRAEEPTSSALCL